MDAQVGTVTPLLTDGVVQTIPAQIQVSHSTQVTPITDGVFVPRSQLIEHINMLEEARRVSNFDGPATLDSSKN